MSDARSDAGSDAGSAAGSAAVVAASTPHRGGSAGAGAALVALAACSTVTTPLWTGYEQRLHHGPTVTTVLFALYVIALIPAALLSPRVLARVGTRRLALGCLTLVAVACLLLWQASSAWELAAGRLLQGLGVGMASGPLTAVLLAARSPADRGRASLASTALITAGAGTGPVVAGALAGPQGSALGAVFGTTIALLAIGAAAAGTLPPRAGRPASGPVRRSAPGNARFWTGALVSLLAWAVGYTVLAVSPSFATSVLADSRPLVVAAPAGLLLLVSAATQAGAARVSPRSSMRAGCLLLATGLLAFVTLVRFPTPLLLFGSLVVLGVGHGLAFLGALRQATSERADGATTGRFFAVTYAGGTAPVLALGVLAGVVGVVAAVAAFALTAAVTCLVVGMALPSTT
jgi:MFS family permease